MDRSHFRIQYIQGIVALIVIMVTTATAHGTNVAKDNKVVEEDHSAHEAMVMMQTGPYQKSIDGYQIPNITLLNQKGRPVEVEKYFDSSKPVVLDFIFATCSTICPVLSATFSNFQKRLGKKHTDVQLVSITIDPDNDTPDVLRDYLARYDAWDSWDILTGRRDNVTQVLKSFNAYVANKMDHFPLTLMRAPGSTEWVRLEGLLSAADLEKEYDLMMTP